MALKPCRECKKKVSTEAATCPSCGAPRPTLKNVPQSEDVFSQSIKTVSKGVESFKKGFYGDEYVEPKKKTSSDDGNIFGFWTGREGLAKTFWLYFIVANMVGNTLVVLAGSEGSGMIIFVDIVRIGWNIFAVIGVFNAADIYKNEMINSGKTYGYATAAKVAVVILILSAIGNSIR
jgi:hypothetical protein